MEQSADSFTSVTKNLEKQIEKEKSASSEYTGSVISKISAGAKTLSRSSALSRALDIIEKHENQEQTDLKMLQEYK